MNLLATTALTLASVAAFVTAIVGHSGVAVAIGVGLLMAGRAVLIAGWLSGLGTAERLDAASSAEPRDRRDPAPGGAP
jgi:hypothetical protein